jgi:KUP system potassium uptake protein
MATIRIADDPHPKDLTQSRSGNEGPSLSQTPTFPRSSSLNHLDRQRSHDDIYNIRSRSRSLRPGRSPDGIGLGYTISAHGEDENPGLRRPGDFKQKQVGLIRVHCTSVATYTSIICVERSRYAIR